MTSLVHLATITLLGLAAAENGDVHALLNTERQLYTSADCGPCTNGCWWSATTPNVGCYAWPKSTCDAQGSAYIWCSSTAPPPAPSPTPITATPTKAPKSSSTTPAPTKKRTKRPTAAPTSSSTSQPTPFSTSPNGCGTCTGCWWTVTTSNVGCYTWSQSTCASYGSAYVWCGGGGTPPSPTPTTTTLKPTSIVSPTPTPPTPTPGTGGYTILNSSSGLGTYYYDVNSQTCNGETPYAEMNGYPSCTSYNLAYAKTLLQYGTNNIVAIDSSLLSTAAGRATYCGKEVKVYKDNVLVSGGPFVAFDACAACTGGGRLDFSVTAIKAINSNACQLGLIPNLRWEITSNQIMPFVP